MTTEDILARIEPRWGKYLDIGPGWEPIAVELDEQIAALVPNYEVHQVKEKFGGLRYYVGLGDAVPDEVRNEVYQLIAAAERKAGSVCEECGEPGSTTGTGRSGYWLRTLCDSCKLSSASASESLQAPGGQ